MKLVVMEINLSTKIFSVLDEIKYTFSAKFNLPLEYFSHVFHLKCAVTVFLGTELFYQDSMKSKIFHDLALPS